MMNQYRRNVGSVEFQSYVPRMDLLPPPQKILCYEQLKRLVSEIAYQLEGFTASSARRFICDELFRRIDNSGRHISVETVSLDPKCVFKVLISSDDFLTQTFYIEEQSHADPETRPE